jgi:chromosome segregation ATPase
MYYIKTAIALHDKDQSKGEANAAKIRDFEARMKAIKEQMQVESDEKAELKKKYENLEKKHSLLISKHSGENSLESLKTKIATLATQLDDSKNESIKLKEVVRRQEAKLSESTKSFEKYKSCIAKALHSVKLWVAKFKPSLTISQGSKDIKGMFIKR